jgi:DNA-binding GntR family transcriptional regulator
VVNELIPLINEHRSLAKLSHEAIRDRILSGHFKPGDWLRQEDLSRQLGVSHTPVREALDRLVADGLAERVPNRGVRVAPIDENDIAEVYCLRLLLEPLVVGLAVENISEEEISPLKMIVEQAEKLTSFDDMPSRRKINREFHMGISRSCGSSTLRRLHEIVWNKYPDWMLYEGLYRDPNTLAPRLQLEIDEHRALLDAISNRNVSLAKRIITSHIKIMKRDLIEVFNISGQILEEKQEQMSL